MIHVKVRWLWEKKHKLLLQHITSRGSRLATQRRPPLREDKSSSPLLPRLSGLLQPWSDVGLAILGGQSLLDVTGPSSPHRVAPPSSTTCCSNKSSSLCPFTPSSCTRTACSFMFNGVHRLPCLSFFFSFLAANHGHRIRLFEGFYTS